MSSQMDRSCEYASPQYHQIRQPFTDLLLDPLSFRSTASTLPPTNLQSKSGRAGRVLRLHPNSDLSIDLKGLEAHPLTRNIGSCNDGFISTVACKTYNLQDNGGLRFTLRSDLRDGASGAVDLTLPGVFFGHARISPQSKRNGIDLTVALAPLERLVLTTRISEMDSSGASQIAVRGDVVLGDGFSISASTLLRPPGIFEQNAPSETQNSRFISSGGELNVNNFNHEEPSCINVSSGLSSVLLRTSEAIIKASSSVSQHTLCGALQLKPHSQESCYRSQEYFSVLNATADLGRLSEDQRRHPNVFSTLSNSAAQGPSNVTLSSSGGPVYALSACKTFLTHSISLAGSLTMAPLCSRTHVNRYDRTTETSASSFSVILSSASSDAGSTHPDGKGSSQVRDGESSGSFTSSAWDLFTLSRACSLAAISFTGKTVSAAADFVARGSSSPEDKLRIEKIGEAADSFATRSSSVAASMISKIRPAHEDLGSHRRRETYDENLPPWITAYTLASNTASVVADKAIQKIGSEMKLNETRSKKDSIGKHFSWAVELSDWAKQLSLFNALTLFSTNSKTQDAVFPIVTLGSGVHLDINPSRKEDAKGLIIQQNTEFSHKSNNLKQYCASSAVSTQILLSPHLSFGAVLRSNGLTSLSLRLKRAGPKDKIPINANVRCEGLLDNLKPTLGFSINLGIGDT